MFTFLYPKQGGINRLYRNIDPQIFDLLQLSKKERECRQKFLDLKKELHDVRSDEKYFAHLNEMILRRRVENAALYYRFVRRERMRFFCDYINRLPAHNSVAA